ncbi:MAG TPA: 2-oxoglutarate dehydrogenase E1 component, partial [Saprospiraceae bacterium]|nr:2-oxoglutarate dehydrogenase E1 component [Saprospiraceae bacterium]
MKDLSAVFNAHPQYIDTLYHNWLNNPDSVETDWQVFFKGFDFALSAANGSSTGSGGSNEADLHKEFGVVGLIYGYRDRGHMLSTTNPIKPRKDRKPRLDL